MIMRKVTKEATHEEASAGNSHFRFSGTIYPTFPCAHRACAIEFSRIDSALCIRAKWVGARLVFKG